MDRATIRERILNRKLTIIPITEEIIGLEDLTGHLAVRELTAAQATRIDKIAVGEDGKEDQGLQVAATFAFALVEHESGLPIFEDEKIIGQLSQVLGLSVLAPVAEIIKKVSGMDKNAQLAAKKNSTTIVESTLDISSTTNSEQAALA